MINEFFKSLFRTLGKIVCYILVGFGLFALVGKLNVKALDSLVDFENSTVSFYNSRYSLNSSPDYQTSGSNDAFNLNYNVDIVFTPTSEDLKSEYQALEGDRLEMAFRVCSTSPISASVANNGTSSIDYIENTGQQCVIHYGETDKIGTIYQIYIFATITRVTYNVGQYPKNLPDNFTFHVAFTLWTTIGYRQYIGIPWDDLIPANYYPSYIYYTKVNKLREKDGLSTISREGRLTFNDVMDNEDSNKTILEKFSEWIADGLSNLGKSILNGFRDLFIPSEKGIGEVLENSSLLVTNFGFIGQSFDFIIGRFANLSGYSGPLPFNQTLNYSSSDGSGGGFSTGSGNAGGGGSGGGFKSSPPSSVKSSSRPYAGCAHLPAFTIGSTSLFDSVTFWEEQDVCIADNPIISDNIGTIRFITTVALICMFVSWASGLVFTILNGNDTGINVYDDTYNGTTDIVTWYKQNGNSFSNRRRFKTGNGGKK